MRTPMKGMGGLSWNLLSFDEDFDLEEDNICPGNPFSHSDTTTTRFQSDKSKRRQNCRETKWELPWRGWVACHEACFHLMKYSTPREISYVPETSLQCMKTASTKILSSKSKRRQSCHETQWTHQGEWSRYLNCRQLMRTSTSSEISCVPESYYHPLMWCQHAHAIEFEKTHIFQGLRGRMQVK